MKPRLPANPATISTVSWPTDTVEQCERRLAQLRLLDTHTRETSEDRELEKASLEERIRELSAPPRQTP
jgi:hypothetical protein